MKKPVSQTCVNCHFFIRTMRLNGGEPYTNLITNYERDNIKNNRFPDSPGALRCHFTVWDEGFNFDHSEKFNIIVKMNRKGYCFFWPYKSGMLLPAAELLQKREYEIQQGATNQRWTIIGLFIAAFGLLASVLFELAKAFHWIV